MWPIMRTHVPSCVPAPGCRTVSGPTAVQHVHPCALLRTCTRLSYCIWSPLLVNMRRMNMRLTYAVLYTSMSCKGRASKVFHKAKPKVSLAWNPTSTPTSPFSPPFPLPHLKELLQLGHETREGRVGGGGGRLAVRIRCQDDGIHLTLLIGRGQLPAQGRGRWQWSRRRSRHLLLPVCHREAWRDHPMKGKAAVLT